MARRSTLSALPNDPLTSRWIPMTLHPKQRALLASTARFRIVPCGRRSGKTELAKRFLVRKAIEETKYDDGIFLASGPIHMQAKRIYWRDLKRLVPPWALAGKPSESELTIPLINGQTIIVGGMDAPERFEGSPLNGAILDEYGNMKPEAWTNHLRPALTDRMGWAWFVGVPEGRNHYYDLFCDKEGAEDWSIHTWTTMEVLPLYLGKERARFEIRQAMNDLDELTFRQEYCADFISFEGLIYYNFRRRDHVISELPYRPDEPLILCLDFNHSPGVAVVCQEDPSTGDTFVIDEVHITDNSNTEKVCRKLLATYESHPSRVYCYGDSTGGAKGSAKVKGSDWEIVKSMLGAAFASRIFYRYGRKNPPVRARLNSMNSRLRAISGRIRMRIDSRCAFTIKDFEGVTAKDDGSGEIDKKANPHLSHLTDALGYYVHSVYPTGGVGSVLYKAA